MNTFHKILWLGLSVLGMVIGGCVSAPSPRMPMILDLPLEPEGRKVRTLDKWPVHDTIALMTLSDASGPNAAPAISQAMLSRLSQRTQHYIGDRCHVSDVQVIPVEGPKESRHLGALLEMAKRVEAESLIVALFSSTESTEAGTFGEERMMTQMPGTTTHNTSLVELGLFNVQQGNIEFQAIGEARETLDRLNVPIGTDQPTQEMALDILRANAGQQALDKALADFTKGCAAT